MKRIELLIIPLCLVLIVALVSYARVRDEPETAKIPELAVATEMPDFSTFNNVSEKKTTFFEYLLPMIRNANARVMAQRERLLDLTDTMEAGGAVNEENRAFVADLATRYRIRDRDEINQKLLSELLLRVDMIPASLILAQAANESAWGTSRFATQANNLFGIWCFSPGCGVTPLYRDEGLTHEVRRFGSVQDGVHYYLRTINSNSAYKQLREIRARLRADGREITGARLAEGLLRYSERGEEYVEEIQAMIRVNRLREYNLAATESDSGSG